MAISGFNQLADRISSGASNIATVARVADRFTNSNTLRNICLLYTSDAADE